MLRPLRQGVPQRLTQAQTFPWLMIALHLLPIYPMLYQNQFSIKAVLVMVQERTLTVD